ncbi:hypothetical protein [Oricola sp.]|uniref:hypothetical protein n=1 Tax=Oricola sp. TaxID=1979950 RepID=UPI0025D8FE64|nr:hypothetical protein [Oricola sp.]MCI5074860.1 hypothetical protein [Oricola sp.]
MPEDRTANIDSQNRHIAQEAQTDTDLESVVPPTWRTDARWRIAALAVVGAVIIVALTQAL